MQRMRTGVTEIEKIFIDDHKDKSDPNFIRKYIVKEKLRNLPLGDKPGDPQGGYYEQSGYTLDEFIKPRVEEVADYDRFEFDKMDGVWPDFHNKETKFTYYYRLAKMKSHMGTRATNLSVVGAPFMTSYFTIEEKIGDTEDFKEYERQLKNYIKNEVGTDEDFEKHIKYVTIPYRFSPGIQSRISYAEFKNLVVSKEWLKHPLYIEGNVNATSFDVVVEKV